MKRNRNDLPLLCLLPFLWAGLLLAPGLPLMVLFGLFEVGGTLSLFVKQGEWHFVAIVGAASWIIATAAYQLGRAYMRSSLYPWVKFGTLAAIAVYAFAAPIFIVENNNLWKAVASYRQARATRSVSTGIFQHLRITPVNVPSVQAPIGLRVEFDLALKGTPLPATINFNAPLLWQGPQGAPMNVNQDMSAEVQRLNGSLSPWLKDRQVMYSQSYFGYPPPFADAKDQFFTGHPGDGTPTPHFVLYFFPDFVVQDFSIRGGELKYVCINFDASRKPPPADHHFHLSWTYSQYTQGVPLPIEGELGGTMTQNDLGPALLEAIQANADFRLDNATWNRIHSGLSPYTLTRAGYTIVKTQPDPLVECLARR